MRPSLTETQVTLWGAKTAGYAAPINFLLHHKSIAELTKASGAKILVALGADPHLDIGQKALELIKQILDLTPLRGTTPKTPDAKGLIDFAAAI